MYIYYLHMSPLFLVFLAINLTLSTIADVSTAISRATNNIHWFYVGLAFNIAAVSIFTYLIRIGGLAISTSIILLLTILINVFFGFLVFHEKIEPLQWVGIGMGVVAVVLISNMYKLLF